MGVGVENVLRLESESQVGVELIQELESDLLSLTLLSLKDFLGAF